eukprot:1477133-Pleurochrysis_carterae.AAC.1
MLAFLEQLLLRLPALQQPIFRAFATFLCHNSSQLHLFLKSSFPGAHQISPKLASVDEGLADGEVAGDRADRDRRSSATRSANSASEGQTPTSTSGNNANSSSMNATTSANTATNISANLSANVGADADAANEGSGPLPSSSSTQSGCASAGFSSTFGSSFACGSRLLEQLNSTTGCGALLGAGTDGSLGRRRARRMAQMRASAVDTAASRGLPPIEALNAQHEVRARERKHARMRRKDRARAHACVRNECACARNECARARGAGCFFVRERAQHCGCCGRVGAFEASFAACEWLLSGANVKGRADKRSPVWLCLLLCLLLVEFLSLVWCACRVSRAAA